MVQMKLTVHHHSAGKLPINSEKERREAPLGTAIPVQRKPGDRRGGTRWMLPR
ncbi:MAG: hypothetical protein QOH71_2336 [Blastocatellia bacterium]|nr:hypothetical protein [Blastocatellia bacterium]